MIWLVRLLPILGSRKGQNICSAINLIVKQIGNVHHAWSQSNVFVCLTTQQPILDSLGSSLVVSMLTFCSNDPNSNPQFFLLNCC